MKSYDYIYAIIMRIFKKMSLTVRNFNLSRFALKEQENPTQNERNTLRLQAILARVFFWNFPVGETLISFILPFLHERPRWHETSLLVNGFLFQ